MEFRRIVSTLFVILLGLVTPPPLSAAQSPAPSAPKHIAKPVATGNSTLDAGTVTNGAYRNKALGLLCRIPAGWVLRTDEMNAQDDAEDSSNQSSADADAPGKVTNAQKDSLPQGTQGSTKNATANGRVLLAAFSRPPEARAEDVNSSIVIAAERAETYPGLKEAAQYLGPLEEVAKAQGFSVVEEPYEFVVGAKTLPREDFQKEVGTRVMRQSTLVLLARGWAVSITFIGGTDDEVEELVQGLSFAAVGAAKR
jgi:hypothetical protein